MFAIGFVLGGAFHIACLIKPSLGPPSPAWRHGLFAAINGLAAAGMIRRPRWFVFPFAVLCAQQLYSHGTFAWEMWRDHAQIDWASIVVLVTMPAALALLVIDRRR